MAKYRKKPVVIEAVQFHLLEYADDPMNGFEEYPQWLLEALGQKQVVPVFESEDYWHMKIATPEGTMKADPGDWIIRGIKGEIYPCKPDIFEATYEQVEES